ncbi:MAG: M23 family metallopeptidase [Thiothrix sp.]|nr:M23 family metallopeptidase [Thiothrix sp.]HPQ95473.1 M23 family metallopeptidase [Thiolinea sp.]
MASPRSKPETSRHHGPARYVASRALIFATLLAGFGNIPVYSKIPSGDDESSPGGTSNTIAGTLHTLNQPLELDLPDHVETYAGHAVDALPSATVGKWELHRITEGDTLTGILSVLDTTTTATELLASEDVAETLTTLKPGAKLFIQLNNQGIRQLIYAPAGRNAYVVSLQDGLFSGKWSKELFDEQQTQVAFTLNHPFHYDANKAGLPISITRQLTRIFRNDVNFRRIQIGDQVSVIFEDYFYQSERIYTDEILAAEFNHKGKVYQRIRFPMGNGSVRYLNPDSDLELKQVAFDRYPIRGGRLSSGFGSRRHPIFRSRRMHSGVDFAAPKGTPIQATGDGTIRFVGQKGAYGNAIMIAHGQGIDTLYGHMSGFRDGLKPGDTIKRGQTIGYVGSTGRSTGNHVHYEFHVNDEPQNPMKVKLPEKGILSQQEINSFRRLAKNMSNQLSRLRETASIDRNLRQQFGG